MHLVTAKRSLSQKLALTSDVCFGQAMVAFYYRSKHSDGACRRGPVMLEEAPATPMQAFGAPKHDSEVPPEVPQANRWLQVREDKVESKTE